MGIVNGGLESNCRGIDELSKSRAIGIEAINDRASVDLLQGSEICAVPPQGRALVEDGAL